MCALPSFEMRAGLSTDVPDWQARGSKAAQLAIISARLHEASSAVGGSLGLGAIAAKLLRAPEANHGHSRSRSMASSQAAAHLTGFTKIPPAAGRGSIRKS